MTKPTPQQPATEPSNTRPLLWGVLVLSAGGNAVTSALGLNVAVSIVFGVVTLAAGIALIANYRKHR
ncbi:hypothetical protein [Amycolatopsis jejuensis]|uniref:hypothetical protein n=1 Tax=Amycolatopsis jejuensis TaxID=330084 RepID=UPI0005244EDD|nr:hypothetical protein [Amycolatopsis jejuensis]